ncbi:MAG: TMEM165/GDT1 family protein [Dissulfurimicrobium sp.]|uniref:TMEM165/GDT1 family protein n=1 Tax=Dissulfurimicrobium sp. TaxID=2022436 RepID=UPI00404901FF
MNLKLFLMVFVSVFIAELGDKTQLATLLFAADRQINPMLVFIGASLALILTSAIGVLAGGFISQYINKKTLRLIAGVGFIAIGLWVLSDI